MPNSPTPLKKFNVPMRESHLRENNPRGRRRGKAGFSNLADRSPATVEPSPSHSPIPFADATRKRLNPVCQHFTETLRDSISPLSPPAKSKARRSLIARLCAARSNFFPASPKIILLTDTVSEESMVDRTGVEHKMAMTRDADHLDFQLSAFDLGRDLNGGHA